MPAYNAERFVMHALNSVFAQDYRPLEVLVVDDGSTDRTAERIQWYGDRVRYFYQDNAGPAAARNLAFSKMTGDFVTFLDADDLWHPAKLSRQMAEFEQWEDLDVSVCHVRNFWNGLPEDERVVFLKRQYEPVMAGIVLQAMLARRTIVDQIGSLDTSFRFGEDTDFYLRLKESGCMMLLMDEILGYRRVHDENMTVEFPDRKSDTMVQVVKAALDRKRAG